MTIYTSRVPPHCIMSNHVALFSHMTHYITKQQNSLQNNERWPWHLASFPGPAQLSIACNSINSDRKLGGAWEWGYMTSSLLLQVLKITWTAYLRKPVHFATDISKFHYWNLVTSSSHNCIPVGHGLHTCSPDPSLFVEVVRFARVPIYAAYKQSVAASVDWNNLPFG